MNRKLATALGAFAILVWSIIIIYFYSSARIGVYLKGGFQTLALIGGLGLGILGLYNLLMAGEKTACGHDHDHGGGDDHAHDHEQETPSGLAINLSILVVPIVCAAVLTPDTRSLAWVRNNLSLASDPTNIREQLALTGRTPATDGPTESAAPPPTPDDAVAGTDSETKAESEPAADPYEFTKSDLDKLVDKNDAGEYMVTVPEIFFTGGDASIQKVLDGEAVETIGQFIEETKNNPNGTRLRVYRMFMECCAADARPLSVTIEFGKTPPEFKELGWYKLHGKMDFEEGDGYSVPVINAVSIEPTEEPSDATF